MTSDLKSYHVDADCVIGVGFRAFFEAYRAHDIPLGATVSVVHGNSNISHDHVVSTTCGRVRLEFLCESRSPTRVISEHNLWSYHPSS